MAEQVPIKELHREIVEMAQRGTDLTPQLEKIADEFRSDESTYLASARWAPLSSEYAAWKASHGHGTTPGVYTGRLRGSLTKKGAQYHIDDVSEHGLRVGTKNPVAKLFNGGTTRQPKRKLVRLKPSTRRKWLTDLQTYLAEGP